MVPPTFSAPWSPRRAVISPSLHRIDPRFELARKGESIIACYPMLETIHLVMDNLNIHCRKSLTDSFGAETAPISGTDSRFTTLPATGVG